MEEGSKPGSRSPNPKHGLDSRTHRNSRPSDGLRKRDVMKFSVEGEAVQLKDGRIVEPGTYSADQHNNWEVLEALEAGDIPGVFVIREVGRDETGKKHVAPNASKTQVDKSSVPVVKQSRRGPVVSTNEPRHREHDVTEKPKTIVRISKEKSMPQKAVDGKCHTSCRCDYCVPDEKPRSQKSMDSVRNAIGM